MQGELDPLAWATYEVIRRIPGQDGCAIVRTTSDRWEAYRAADACRAGDGADYDVRSKPSPRYLQEMST